ncbi:MAG: hypothetical protein A7315_12485 [Candidatus Altiarchaeales archaeon WOR_SM1_79]|nr:MAG: hypothetical protein A7315_12485 [Candidatus Altiarchaeales archaeon WOR_SM1_79]
MNRKIVAVWMSLAIIFGFFVIIVDIALIVEAPTTLYVGGLNPGNYSKIQWAIDNASDGDTVFVYNGTYYENVIVNKTINLTGEDKNNTIINGSGSGDVVIINSDFVNFTGFKVIASGDGLWDSGVVLKIAKNCNISNNIIASNRHGLFLNHSNLSNFYNNNISENNGCAFIMIYSNDNYVITNKVFMNYVGLYLSYSQNNKIIHNNISSSTSDGVQISSSNRNKLLNNYFISNSKGIYLFDSADNDIIYNTALNNGDGIYLLSSERNNITNNSIHMNDNYGICFIYSDYNNITENIITSNVHSNIYIILSTNITISTNKMINNGILIDGEYPEYWNTHNIDILNKVNEKPLHYLKNQKSSNVPIGAGQVILANCTNVSVKYQKIANASVGILLGFSSDCNVSENNVSFNYHYGISLYKSVNNKLNNNTALNNRKGIYFYLSDDNLIVGNKIFSNVDGLFIYKSHYNNILSNNITSNYNGITLETLGDGSQWNRIINNIIFSNQNYGLHFFSALYNKIYHNNIMSNANQAYDNLGNNDWDASYPLGGNYWSDYSGVDFYKGPNQNIPGSDGIGDTPYTNIQGGTGAQDDYPLMQPYKPLENYTLLRQGWNLISIPLIQEEKNLTRILGSIDGWYDAVQWYDPSDSDDPWKHNMIGKPFGNDLFKLNETMGFWIHITQPGDTIFLYNGTQPSSNQTIQLYEGWNMVGYPSLSNHNRTVGLNNLTFGTDVDTIWWYDAATQTWHDMGPDDFFVPGRGYWVHAKVECEWEFPL